jgi:hypothetical protein
MVVDVKVEGAELLDQGLSGRLGESTGDDGVKVVGQTTA